MINEIIDLINSGFDGLHKDEIILGIAQSIHRSTQSGSVEFIPGIVHLGTDEAVYAGIDDINSIIIYHKTNTASLVYGPHNTGYGDGRAHDDTVSCSLFAVWDTRKLKIDSADMLILLRSRMPHQILDIPGIKRAVVAPSSASLNTRQIFESEYKFSENYLLPVYMKFIQINYTIQLRYDPMCIEKCINCSN